MKNMIVCPKCGELVYFNSYFGAYICEHCSWEDASYAKDRDSFCATFSALKTFRNRSSQRKVFKIISISSP